MLAEQTAHFRRESSSEKLFIALLRQFLKKYRGWQDNSDAEW